MQKLIKLSLVLLAALSLTTAALLTQAQPTPEPSPAPSPTTTPALPPAPFFKAEIIASRLNVPWSLKFLPDGRVFFTEREGRVRVIENGLLLDTPALTVRDIKVWSKMGLLSLEVDPAFAINHYLYLAECHGTSDAPTNANWVRIVRYRETNNRLVEPHILIDNIPCFHNHAGGRLAFGPDGKLYITTGDADQPRLAQRLDTLNGKILRLNSDGSIPLDNPYVSTPKANPAIWSFGHRNPQGLAFQPDTGLLFETEHGPNGGDEINFILPSLNYGWPQITHERSAPGIQSPIAQFTPSVAPAGAVFYQGDMFPALRGNLLVPCLRGEAILRVNISGTHATSIERLAHESFGRLRDLAVAPDGSLWISTSEFDPPEGRRYPDYDRILRLTPADTLISKPDHLPTPAELPRPVGARAIYLANCLACHGDGADSRIPSLFDGKWTQSPGTDPDIRRSITEGILNRGMPSFATTLTPAETDQLIAYIHEREKSPPPTAP